MGSNHSVDRSVIKSSSVSEKDVTLGLKLKCLDKYLDSIFPENFPNSLKQDLQKKLKKRIEISDSEVKGYDNYKLNSETNIINDDFYIFLYAFENLENEKINIAYQLITGKIEVSKSYEYKTFLGIKYGTKYESVTETEKSFYQKYFGVEEEKITQYLAEQKKYLKY